MGYYINLESITLDEYRAKLESAYLPPSRMILKERLEERFNYFKNAGIINVKELQQTLKKKEKFAELSKAECFSGDYFTILLREINSMHPKPNKIREFAGISADTVAKLEKAGINDTLKLFDKVKNKDARNELASNTGINNAVILELTKLTDLSRIKWVGVTFARILYDLGIDTVEKATHADYHNLHQKVNGLNKERNIYKGQIGLNDMKIFVNAAKEVPLDIEY